MFWEKVKHQLRVPCKWTWKIVNVKQDKFTMLFIVNAPEPIDNFSRGKDVGKYGDLR